MRRLVFVLVPALLAASCSEPPEKEFHQAQGAIEAARAAGAEQYATADFTAALTAIERYHEAVAQRDYRLALSHALDARERARESARRAADEKAARRSRAERTFAGTATDLQQLTERVRAAQAAKVPAADLRPLRALIAQAEPAVQKARAALTREDYAGAEAALVDVQPRLAAALKTLEKIIAARAPRRR
jgi:hypothetical protein